MKLIGKLAKRHSRDIPSSRIGVGFGCLEREMCGIIPQIYQLERGLGRKTDGRDGIVRLDFSVIVRNSTHLLPRNLA
jgi:hypothetical protein